VAAGQLGLTGGAQPIFFPNPRKQVIQLLLEAQQHKKYAQTTPLDDEVSSLLNLVLVDYCKGFEEKYIKIVFVSKCLRFLL
jgi:hypothetical protein